MTTDMTTEQAGHPAKQTNHWLRMLVIWLVLALAADLVIWFIWYPHMPPGDMSDSARHQQFDIAVLSVTGAPVVIAVLLYFIYSIITFRARPGDEGDGAPIHGNNKVAAAWIITTAAIVMWMFAFGTAELIGPAGAGAGEGPNPIWKLAGKTSSTWTPGAGDMLQVQAIGQQWTWTYRFPQFGGVESTVLELPINTPVTFHVTSLDVIHSFWAYQLGVKADANPQVDNVAYTTPKQLGSFRVQCNELCGIWHGAMFNYGKVVSQSDFETWVTGVQSQEQSDGILADLPPYSLTYDPTVVAQLGKNLTSVIGVTGATGYYYPPSDPVQP